jgi:Fe-S cluster assembly protein SufD
LLSSHAEINAKPELEIYADDVKCAHGTTMGQLNETEVYYLKTRGISAEQAKLILTLGFVLEVVRSVPIESIADFWEQQLTDILGFQIS